MNLKEQTLAALAGLPLASAPQTLVVDVGDARLRCELVALDSLACAFDSLRVQVDSLATADLDKLKKVSQKVSDRLTYLLEAIATIEVDKESLTVLLRSKKPQKASDGTSYYELLVRKGGELLLARYRQAPGMPREKIACNVTREVFGRLVEDLSSV